MGKRLYNYLFMFILCIGVCVTSLMIYENRICMQQEVADHVLRLHIKADSDEEAAQALKLQVKDAVLKDLAAYQNEMENIQLTTLIIEENKNELLEHIQKVIEQSGMHVSADLKLGKTWFPQKSYGDVTLPEGQYNSVIVELGSGQGKNWWCVLFPQLCFVDPVNGYVPEESKAILKEELSEKTYNEIVNEDIIIKFKIVEWLKNFHI